jgi:hypothetical protein
MARTLRRQSSLASILRGEYEYDASAHPEVEDLDPSSPFAGALETRYTKITVDGREVSIGETVDFSRDDPWSKLLISSVKTLHDEGEFKGDLTIIEAGVGDGRNLLQAIGVSHEGGDVDKDWTGRIIGIDIDPRRVALSKQNFEAIGLGARSFCLEGDAVRKLQDLAALTRSGRSDKLKGAAIACLPQAPLDAETHSSADGFDPALPSLARARDITLRGQSVSDYGLALNAAWLLALRDCVDAARFKHLVVLSDRVPPEAVAELFARTGWAQIRAFAAPAPTRQVPPLAQHGGSVPPRRTPPPSWSLALDRTTPWSAFQDGQMGASSLISHYF